MRTRVLERVQLHMNLNQGETRMLNGCGCGGGCC